MSSLDSFKEIVRLDEPLAPYTWMKIGGPAQYLVRPRHRDELVQVVEGTTTLHIMADEGPQTHALKAGMLVIVPQGMWHRFEAPDGVCLMTATPKPTEHLTVDVEDPRTLSAAQKSDATEEKWR